MRPEVRRVADSGERLTRERCHILELNGESYRVREARRRTRRRPPAMDEGTAPATEPAKEVDPIETPPPESGLTAGPEAATL